MSRFRKHVAGRYTILEITPGLLADAGERLLQRGAAGVEQGRHGGLIHREAVGGRTGRGAGFPPCIMIAILGLFRPKMSDFAGVWARAVPQDFAGLPDFTGGVAGPAGCPGGWHWWPSTSAPGRSEEDAGGGPQVRDRQETGAGQLDIADHCAGLIRGGILITAAPADDRSRVVRVVRRYLYGKRPVNCTP